MDTQTLAPTPVPATPAPSATPAPAPTPAPQEAKPKSGSGLLIGIIVVLLALILGGAAYWFFSNYEIVGTSIMSKSGAGADEEGNEQEDDADNPDAEENGMGGGGDEDGEDEEEDEEEVSDFDVPYEGTAINATLYPDWTIQEYFDGNGSNMLVEGVVYSGLTGITIARPDGTIVFRMKGVYGIGGVSGCMEYFQFPDDNAAYYAQVVADTAEIGEVPAVTVINDGTYVEYSFLGLRVRRAGTHLYWDKIDLNTFFEAACGIDQGIITPVDLTFTGDGSNIGNYRIDIVNAPTADELDQLDAILNHILPI